MENYLQLFLVVYYTLTVKKVNIQSILKGCAYVFTIYENKVITKTKKINQFN